MTMAAGDLALGNLASVLHAHLPYVRSSEPGSLEEDWYFQALQECYLPLLQVLETAAADRHQRPRHLQQKPAPYLRPRRPCWCPSRPSR